MKYCMENSQIFDFIDKNRFEKFIKTKNFHKSDVNNKFLFNFISTKIFLESCNDTK